MTPRLSVMEAGGLALVTASTQAPLASVARPPG